jgi:hypothetical protein
VKEHANRCSNKEKKWQFTGINKNCFTKNKYHDKINNYQWIAVTSFTLSFEKKIGV